MKRETQYIDRDQAWNFLVKPSKKGKDGPLAECLKACDEGKVLTYQHLINRLWWRMRRRIEETPEPEPDKPPEEKSIADLSEKNGDYVTQMMNSS